jgi:hypothetical protein
MTTAGESQGLEGPQARASTAALVVAFGLTVLGVLVLIVGAVASLGPVALVGGVGLVLAGLLLAFVHGFLEARSAGAGVVRSVWRGFGTLLSWLTMLG